jgi:hypothetical protein
VQATTTGPTITVTADGTGVVSHAGIRLADLTETTRLTELAGRAQRGAWATATA